MSKLYPIILSGGVGSRLWPISTKEKPKQFHPFIDGSSLLEQTIHRFQNGNLYEAPLIIGCEDHKQEFLDYRSYEIILEPCGRNTAPAAAMACLHAKNKNRADDVLVFLPADHYISEVSLFHQAVQQAAQVAERGYIATIGIPPSFPATQYGYIQKGERFSEHVFIVDSFVEKPDAQRAVEFLSSGDYLWNSGVFVVKPDVFLQELGAYRPDILKAAEKAFETLYKGGGVWKMEEESYTVIPPQSIDYAVMEHTDKGVVVPSNMGWSDIGTWHSLWEVSSQDESGNVAQGSVVTDDIAGCYALSSGPEIVLKSVQDLVVVATPERVLVVDRKKSSDIREVVKRMKG